jgi:hypothetical protein
VVSFHGIFDAGGTANNQNAVVYYDFATGKLIPILDGATPGVGHIDGLAIIGDDLFLEDMSQNGEINGLNGLGQGAIYEFDLNQVQATPEPGTWLLVLSGLIIPLLRKKTLHKN